MSRVRLGRALLVVAAAVAVVVLSSSANAAAPIKQGGDPKDPQGPVAGEVQPTPEEDAASAVMKWIAENPRPDAGSVRILADHKTVEVYWKGDPPADLQQIVAAQPVPMTIRKATYSRDELVAAARSLVRANKGVVTSAGPNTDLSAVGVSFSSSAPQTALAAVRAQSAVPVESRGVLDLKATSGRGAHPLRPYVRSTEAPQLLRDAAMSTRFTAAVCCTSPARTIPAPPVPTSRPDHITMSPRHGTVARAIGMATTAATTWDSRTPRR